MSCWYNDSSLNDNIIVSSRIRLARNLSDIPFPRRMTDEMLCELKNRVKSAIDEINDKGQFKLKYIDTCDIPENEIYAMVERHTISPDFAKNHSNKAVVISEDESISIMIGEEDHLRIQVLKGGFAPYEAYEIADKLDTELNTILCFAYDDRLGFLTECPTNIGTGLRASLMLHLPVCESVGKITIISETASKIGLTVRGMYGEGSKSSASLYQISNQITLGISEKNAIENLKVIAEQIVNMEESERLNLDRVSIEDSVYRAYGTLKYARLLTSEEVMKLISLIKLGVSMGIIENVNINSIGLMIETQPNMLIRRFGELDARERDEARAKMVRNIL